MTKPKEEKAKVDLVLVARLKEHYYWWTDSYYHKLSLKRLLDYAPRPDYASEYSRKRDGLAWNCGRVRHFYDLFKAGKPVDPIMMDNVCEGNRIYPEPILLDGHHRFAASIFAKVEKIPTYYSGRMDLLRYLKGLRKTKPEY